MKKKHRLHFRPTLAIYLSIASICLSIISLLLRTSFPIGYIFAIVSVILAGVAFGSCVTELMWKKKRKTKKSESKQLERS